MPDLTRMLAAGAAALWVATLAQPQAARGAEDEAARLERGHALFLNHCAACHGESARGDGPLAPLLNVPVADLTRIAARRGGEFPLVEVVRIIDGRAELRGHGGPMLVYGQILGGGSAVLDTPEDGVLQTRGDILDIALWLKSIQERE